MSAANKYLQGSTRFGGYSGSSVSFHGIIFTVPSSLYHPHCTIYIVPSTARISSTTRLLYHLHCTIYTVPSILYHLHCTIFAVPSSLYNLHCTIFIVPSSLYHLHCTIFTVPYSLYHLHYFLRCNGDIVLKNSVQVKGRYLISWLI